MVTKACEKHDLFPIRAFLSGLKSQEIFGNKALPIALLLSAEFERESATINYRDIFQTLQFAHQEALAEEKLKFIKIVARYLEGAKNAGIWDQLKILKGFSLPNSSGIWKECNTLAPPCAGIRPSALLHSVLAEALAYNTRERQGKTASDKEVQGSTVSAKASAQDLKKLLAPFRERLEEKAVGILPALLGSDPETQKLAEEMLDGIQPASILDELIPTEIQVNDQLGGDLRNRAKTFTFRVIMIRGSEVELESVAGSIFRAPLLDSHDTIFLPHSNGQMLRWVGGGTQILCVSEPTRYDSLSDAELRDVLVSSIRELLWWAYVHKPSNLEEVFEKYASLGQMSLGVARQEILRSADTQLQILGVLPKALEKARVLSNEARMRLAEADSGIGNVKRLRQEGTKAEEEARALFLFKLDSDSEVHDALLSGLRRRISQQQYEIDSVPFEIFQNADDAAVELFQHTNPTEDAKRQIQRFILQIESDAIVFHYAGRPINSACGLVGPQADRFRRDLVKMLLLNGSDKNTVEHETVTGRFGLGFKSVFLLTDKPCILSGALAFDIAGAIWPRPLDKDSMNRLTQNGEEHLPLHRQRTTILLPSSKPKIDDACQRFLDLAPWLPIFARKIRSVELRHSKYSAIYRWEPERLEDLQCSNFGAIQTDEGLMHQLEIYDDKIQWVFSLEDGAISDLPESLPWLWVTAPTRECSLGFALNGPFALDPGRTRLSKQHEDVSRINRDLFQRAASLLYREFGALSGHPQIHVLLGTTEPYLFWNGLWNLMTHLPRPKLNPDGADHLALALWPRNADNGYAALIKKHKVLPNGLLGSLRKLVRTESLTHSIHGWLGTAKGVHLLTKVIENERCIFGVENCCSDEVASELQRRSDLKVEAFDLAALIRGENQEEVRLDAALAEWLSTDLWPNLINPYKSSFEGLSDAEEVLKLKSLGLTVKFLSEDGTWKNGEFLLLTQSHLNESNHTDEQLRAGFAPASNLLSSSYSATAIRIFIACRSRLQADAKDLSKWIQDCICQKTLALALNYLAKGEMRQSVALALGDDWLQSIRFTTAFESLERGMRLAVESVFKIAQIENERKQFVDGVGGFETPSETSPDFDLQQNLSPEDIVHCWCEKTALNLFTVAGRIGRLVVPDSMTDNDIASRLRRPDSLEGKAAWYRLLCMGCTLGLPLGTRALASLENLWNTELTEEFWQTTIPTTSSNISNVNFNSNLDSFFEAKIHALFRNENASGENAAFWRRIFYDFRKIHYLVFINHLPETIIEISSFPEVGGQALVQFLKTGHIPHEIQDINTPRFKGVIGQSMTAPLLFVMRELRRLGVVNQQFDDACYYMNSPSRRVARRLGWISDGSAYLSDFSNLVGYSEIVHKRMKEEIPELAEFFDLPLQLYAYKNPR
jgi:hypothetical protein